MLRGELESEVLETLSLYRVTIRGSTISPVRVLVSPEQHFPVLTQSARKERVQDWPLKPGLYSR